MSKPIRITKEIREQFVQGVLKDTPDKSTELINAIKDAMNAQIKKEIPKPVYEFWKAGYGSYLQTCAEYSDPNNWRERVWYPYNSGGRISFEKNPGVIKARKAFEQYQESRKQLAVQLQGLIAGFTTVKAAREGLPEFAKYLPAEDSKPAYAVAVVAANVVSELNKAGWPDEKKK